MVPRLDSNTSPNSTSALNTTLDVLEMLHFEVNVAMRHAGLRVPHEFGEFDVAYLADAVGAVRMPRAQGEAAPVAA